MKIEPRHNLKRPAYIAAVAVTAVAALVSGCGATRLEGTAQSMPDDQLELGGETYAPDDQLALSGETSVCDTSFPDTCDSATEGGISTDSEGDIGVFRSKIEDIENAHPGQYRYSITSVYDEDRDGRYFVLTCWDNGEPSSLVIDSGRWMWFEDDGTHGIEEGSAVSYSQIMDMPFLFDTRFMLHSELEDDGTVSELPTEFADSIDDGVYSGRIIAVSDAGDKALLSISQTLTFDREEIEALNVGDPIGVADLRIGEDLSIPDDGYTKIALESSYLTDVYLTTSPDDSNVLCLTGADGAVFGEPVIVEVYILPYCEESDNYDEIYDGTILEAELTGNTLVDSYFWHCVDTQERYYDGWIMTDASVDSVYIRYNTVFQVDIRYTADGLLSE